MPESRAPYLGCTVLYTDAGGTASPAIVTHVHSTTELDLKVQQAGVAPFDVDNITFAETQGVNESWTWTDSPVA